MSNDFADRIAQSRKTGGEARVRAADTFIAAPATPAPAAKEPRQMLTLRIPVSMHETLRRTAFETGVSMQDQLIAAWELQQRQLG